MKRLTHFISAMLTLALLFALHTVANAEITHNLTIYNNSTVNITILEGTTYYCAFTPNEDGVYTFTSMADNFADDLDAVLYCGDMDLAWDNDSGDYNNFKLTYPLTKGVKYTLAINSYWEDTVVCPIKVAFAEKEYLTLSPTVLSLDNDAVFKQDCNDYYYEFTPETSGMYKFYSKGCNETDSYAQFFKVTDDCLVSFETADDSAFGNDFTFTAELTSNQKYLVKAHSYFEGEDGFICVTQDLDTVTTDFEVDNEKYLIIGATEGMTAAEFKAHFSGEIAIFDEQHNALEDTAAISTDDKVILNSTEYSIVIKGDVNGDGKINSTDFMQVRRFYLSLYSLNDACFAAGDVNDDGKITSVDFMRIRSHYLGRYNLYA